MHRLLSSPLLHLELFVGTFNGAGVAFLAPSSAYSPLIVRQTGGVLEVFHSSLLHLH